MTDKLTHQISDLFSDNTFIKGILSSPKKRSEDTPKKTLIKPFLKKGEVQFQFEDHVGKKVLHKNLDRSAAIEYALSLLNDHYRQGQFYTGNSTCQILISKKGKVKIVQSKGSGETADLSHNKTKQYVLADGEPVDFLIHLGIMSPEGQVYKKKYPKFRQLNKYLEFIDQILKNYKDETGRDTIRIVDFGCGKAYLTFALYYYLRKQGISSTIIGLDLKDDVIDYCNKVAMELEYKGLSFLKGDIKDHHSDEPVDMVITLHACDTATDEAIGKALGWDAGIILTVPCCQHELFSQLQSEKGRGLLKYGLIKERLASLLTDSSRALLLEAAGYQVDVLEFIDMEHTPKNLMIRAKKGSGNGESLAAYNDLKNEWNFSHHLEELINKQGLR